MDSFNVIIQVLLIVVLLMLIGFFSVVTYMLIVLASRLREILDILDLIKKIKGKINEIQTSVGPRFRNGFSGIATTIMNVLTTILYRK